ncbi:thioredoxin isoform X7 [Rissa tridactyla]|uniref:thioredoxin isoform X7 n=1 Tax=Rissa tridactyla TaxID=75485 RepID=UPI0023BAEA89|nr:thioredoxin isoform X7 [Rissa tridactyla]
MVKSVGSLSEFEAELKSAGEKLIVVDFSATWCGPCKMIKPFFHSLCEKYGDVVFIEIDVDDAQDVATHCDVKCMPTFQFYKNGKKESQGEHHGKVSPKIGHQWPNYPTCPAFRHSYPSAQAKNDGDKGRWVAPFVPPGSQQ